MNKNYLKDSFVYETHMTNILIFGASGSIGNYIFNSFKREKNYNVYGTSSKNNVDYIEVDSINLHNLQCIEKLDVVVWCQGYNFNDNIFDFNEDEYLKIMNINVLFIIKTLNFLLINDKINDKCKMVIISSIWEQFSRNNKLSYSVSKSALSGLVKSLSCELSHKKILINNVLPGVVNNEMTRKTLNEEQVEYIKKYLNFDRMVELDDIFKTVKFLTIENSGITGESITVDLGFTKVRKYE